MSRSIEFRHATVVDGTGDPPSSGHVLIDGDEIVRVGTTPSGADREIDLEGAVLAPGFIDMHSHSELRLFDRPGAPEKITQGITLEIMGQDGVSVAPTPRDQRDEWRKRVRSLLGTKETWPWTQVADFLDRRESVSPAVNCA